MHAPRYPFQESDIKQYFINLYLYIEEDGKLQLEAASQFLEKYVVDILQYLGFRCPAS
ncbi:MAG: hypothetical protein QXF28_02420 [Nitrososphaerota archaeon]